MTEYHTLRDLEELTAALGKEVWEVIQQADMEENERTVSESCEKMLQMYLAMKDADATYDGSLRSASRRAGGDGAKLREYNEKQKNICGPFMGKVMEKAIKMGESNACMRRIVAAPTAGAAGGCQAEIGSASAMAAGAVNAVTSARLFQSIESATGTLIFFLIHCFLFLFSFPF